MQGCFKVIKNEALINQSASQNTGGAGELKEIDYSELEKRRHMHAQRQSI
jgi:hypothetical protein